MFFSLYKTVYRATLPHKNTFIQIVLYKAIINYFFFFVIFGGFYLSDYPKAFQ